MSCPHAHTLVLGGARSGKSAWAEARVVATGGAPVYVATAQALDAEMRERIGHHRAVRDDRWTTIEEPLDLPATLAREAGPGRCVLVDCLTLWLTNLLLLERDPGAATDELAAALRAARGPVVLVSNEVGQGVVPMNALARTFVDHAGRLHQALAAECVHVVLIVAGLPLVLKGAA